MSKGPLSGIRVLCVNNYLAGNYGPQLLALHGADVVKIELPGRGDVMRGSAPFVPVGDGRSWSHFELRLLRGKSSIALDVHDEQDYAVFARLVAKADVVWTNLLPASARRAKVDWPSVFRLNPRAVYASITGFGLPDNGKGEYSETPAFDILVHGLAGLMSRNADDTGQPVYNGLPIADHVASLYGATGVLLGLRQRDLTGKGCCIDVAMFDAMIAVNEKALTMYALTGEVPPPRASATTAPFGLFPTRDGWVCIAVGSDVVWRRFCTAIGRPELAEEERLRRGTDRVRLADLLRDIVEEFTAVRDSDTVVRELLAHNVPAGPVLEVDTILGSGQVTERPVVQQLRTRDGRELPVVGSPILVSGQDPPVGLMPPELDENRDAILAQWLGEEP